MHANDLLGSASSFATFSFFNNLHDHLLQLSMFITFVLSYNVCMESVLITCMLCEVSYQAHLHTLIMCTGASSELVFSPVTAGHYLVTVLPLLREPPTLSSLGPETIVGSAAVHVEHVVVVAGESIVAIACICLP